MHMLLSASAQKVLLILLYRMYFKEATGFYQDQIQMKNSFRLDNQRKFVYYANNLFER